jgi:hypothetical protein
MRIVAKRKTLATALALSLAPISVAMAEVQVERTVKQTWACETRFEAEDMQDRVILGQRRLEPGCILVPPGAELRVLCPCDPSEASRTDRGWVWGMHAFGPSWWRRNRPWN